MKVFEEKVNNFLASKLFFGDILMFFVFIFPKSDDCYHQGFDAATDKKFYWANLFNTHRLHNRVEIQYPANVNVTEAVKARR